MAWSGSLRVTWLMSKLPIITVVKPLTSSTLLQSIHLKVRIKTEKSVVMIRVSRINGKHATFILNTALRYIATKSEKKNLVIVRCLVLMKFITKTSGKKVQNTRGFLLLVRECCVLSSHLPPQRTSKRTVKNRQNNHS